MKSFYLLRLERGANKVMNEVKYPNESAAITFYQRLYPELNLNNNGYARVPDANIIESHWTSYCIATRYDE